MSRMAKLFFKNKLRLALYLLLAPVCAVTSILFTLSLEPIISAATLMDGGLLLKATVTSLICAGLDMSAGLLLRRSQLSLLHGCMDSMRRKLMGGILQRPASSFQGRDTTGYISLFSNDTARLKDTYFQSICNIYEGIWSFALSMATLLYFSPWIGLFLIAVGIVSINLPNLFTKKLHEKQEEQMESAEHHLSFLHDIFCGYWIIKNHCVEAIFGEKYNGKSKNLAKADFEGEYYPFKVSWISIGITTLSFIGVIALSAYSVVQGRISASIVLSLSQLMGGVLAPLETIPQCVSQIKGARKIADKVLPYMDGSSENSSMSFANLKSDWLSISIDNISFAYEPFAKPVIDGASLQIERGKKYVVVGRSGSGKSTLAKILAGMYPAPFTLTVDGVSEEPSALAPHISYVNQNAFLFNDTVYQNVSLFRDIPKQDVENILERMQLKRTAASGEGILSVSAGEDGAQLSGGEKQRIALARELIMKKDILILDEYTSNLDPATAKELDELVLALDGVTCIVITHQLDSLLLKKADVVLSLEDGKLVKI